MNMRAVYQVVFLGSITAEVTGRKQDWAERETGLQSSYSKAWADPMGDTKAMITLQRLPRLEQGNESFVLTLTSLTSF